MENEMKESIELLEWGYMTLKDKLQFGLPEEEAIKAREKRVRGVLKDAIKRLKEIEAKDWIDKRNIRVTNEAKGIIKG
jgi:hypothetical protein